MAPCKFMDLDETSDIQKSTDREEHLCPSVGDKLEAILAEYETLRSEILIKTQLQHRLFQFHVLALVAIISAVIIPDGLGLRALILVPIESSIIGVWYLDHATSIIKIGNYIQTFIEPRVCSLLNEEKIMNWENFVRSEKCTNKIKWQYFNIRTFRLLSFLTFEGPSVLILLAILVASIVRRSEIAVISETEQLYVLIGWVIGFIVTIFLFMFEKYRHVVIEAARQKCVPGDRMAGEN